MTTCARPHPTIPSLTCPHDPDHDMACFIVVATDDPHTVKVIQWIRPFMAERDAFPLTWSNSYMKQV